MTTAVVFIAGTFFVIVVGYLLNSLVNTIEDLSNYVRAVDDGTSERLKRIEDRLQKNMETRLEVLEERMSVINHKTIKEEWEKKCKHKMK